ncbi:MAG: hypothetical protein M1541_21890 [Acidobacteria bacterium]|nr:hypothetical protein [Acidobacteriota bacterium]
MAIAVVCVLSALESVGRLSEERGDTRDVYGVELTIDRMAVARSLLPPGARVAYLSDVRPNDTSAGTLAFLTAQYALVPAVLVLSGKAPRAEWAVGNFSSPRVDSRAFGEAAGFEMLRNCGRGVVVYRRKGG